MALDLKAKLARLTPPPAPATPPPNLADEAGDDRITRLRALIDDVVQRDARREREPRRAHAPQPLPFGEEVATPAGPLRVVEQWLDPQYRYGRVAVAEALEVSSQTLAALALDATLDGLDPKRALFFDTETTGLAGGAGTVAFLVGLAWFEDGALKLEQLVLRDLGREAPMLTRLAERVREASLLVSYNGKSFDWPLLRTRFVMQRVACPEVPPHLDLLHCARRLLAREEGGLRLTEVERSLLGCYREDDIDGAEIPSRYFAYLRGADPDLLAAVLRHNADDLIAMPAILAELGARYSQVRDDDAPDAHLRCARLAERARDTERALRFADAVGDGRGDAHTAHAAHALRGRVLRRGDARAAVAAWQAALDAAVDAEQTAAARLALAKLHEHALGEPALALRHARHTEPAEGAHAHGRRLGRLLRRLHAARS